MNEDELKQVIINHYRHSKAIRIDSNDIEFEMIGSEIVVRIKFEVKK
jgi:hypothetical protein